MTHERKKNASPLFGNHRQRAITSSSIRPTSSSLRSGSIELRARKRIVVVSTHTHTSRVLAISSEVPASARARINDPDTRNEISVDSRAQQIYIPHMHAAKIRPVRAHASARISAAYYSLNTRCVSFLPLEIRIQYYSARSYTEKSDSLRQMRFINC